MSGVQDQPTGHVGNGAGDGPCAGDDTGPFPAAVRDG